MLRFLLRRLAGSIFVIFVIATASFFLMRLAPGSPFLREDGKAISPEILENMKRHYDMDQPLGVQYIRQMKRIFLHLDFGYAMRKNRSVNELIAEGFPVTLELGCYALLIALSIGIPAGIVAALRQNTLWDYSAMAIAMIGVSVPNFVLGPILQIFFGLKLGVLPVGGWETWQHRVLPAFTLGAMYAAAIARLTRGGMLEVIRQDFVRTARAKGLPEALIVFRHMVRGGLLPVVSYLGPATAFILTGSIVIEKIYSVPGIGRYFVDSALNRDYTLALGMVVFFSAIMLLMNILVDLAYTFIDPRIRHD